jgi:hypothetical protein
VAVVERAVVAAAEAAAEEAAAEHAAAETTYARLMRLELEVDGAGGEGSGLAPRLAAAQARVDELAADLAAAGAIVAEVVDDTAGAVAGVAALQVIAPTLIQPCVHACVRDALNREL